MEKNSSSISVLSQTALAGAKRAYCIRLVPLQYAAFSAETWISGNCTSNGSYLTLCPQPILPVALSSLLFCPPQPVSFFQFKAPSPFMLPNSFWGLAHGTSDESSKCGVSELPQTFVSTFSLKSPGSCSGTKPCWSWEIRKSPCNLGPAPGDEEHCVCCEKRFLKAQCQLMHGN